MIFGKTWVVKEKETQERLKMESRWIKKFAFFPVHLDEGTWIFLESYYFKHNHFKDYHNITWYRSQFTSKKYKLDENK